MTKKTIALFTYDFPHLRTQEFMQRLFLLGYTCAVYAQPWQELAIAAPFERIFMRRESLMHPAEIAKAYDWLYVVGEHNDARPRREEVGIIAGARILSAEVIKRFARGIINFHTGHLPRARGLDTPLWSVLEDIPPFISVHWINDKIDAGHMIALQKVPLYPDDKLVDYNERLFEMQLALLEPVLKAAYRNDYFFPLIETHEHPLHRKMNAHMEREAALRFFAWRDRWLKQGHTREEIQLWQM